MSASRLIFSPDILRLLTDLLYPEPKMAIREILANAADAITMGLPYFPRGADPQILITPDRTNFTLVVEDNGVGLKLEEVDVLNQVGADAAKRERFQKLLEDRGARRSDIQENLAQLIGRYAIGRLACLCIASEVTIESKSLVDPQSPGVRWQMWEGAMDTKVTTPIDQHKPGTRVILRIKDQFRDQILVQDQLERIVREYGVFLPYRVFINAPVGEPLNILQPVIYDLNPGGAAASPIAYRPRPERGDDVAASLDVRFQILWDRIYEGLAYDPPISILPLVTEHTRGMLFIPLRPEFREMGRVRLWCRRMFVKTGEEDLLPDWSQPFLGGVIDCQLDPNLSRTDLLRSDEKEYNRVKEEIEGEIVRQLGLLVTYGAQWEAIVSRYRLPLVHGCNCNQGLLERIGHHIPFRKAITVKGPETAAAWITLEGYKNFMERRRGVASEVPFGTEPFETDPKELATHQRTVYYYTGEGSLMGIIERETVLHASTPQDVALLQRWSEKTKLRAVNIGHELPFDDAPGYNRFVEIVRDAIGSDVDRRSLVIRPVRMDHRRDLPCMLTSINPRQRRSEQYVRELNELPDEDFKSFAKKFEGGPFRLDTMTRSQVTDLLVKARVMAEEDRERLREEGTQEVFYLNMSNDLMLHLANDVNFETSEELQFRAKALHEIWHSAKIKRGEPIIHPNSEHHFQTASDFLDAVISSLYLPLRKARKELERERQARLEKPSTST